MSAYNVVNRAALASGQPEDISVVLANLDAIAAVINGGLDNSNIGAAAGIVKSKLAALGIVNADIDAAAAIAISKLAGYPADATKALLGDGSWGSSGAMTKLWDSTDAGIVFPTASFTTGALPSTYRSLVIDCTFAANVAGPSNLYMRFNGDSSLSYGGEVAQFASGAFASFQNATLGNADRIYIGNAVDQWGGGRIVLPHYSSTHVKTAVFQVYSGQAAGGFYWGGGGWNAGGAISTITFALVSNSLIAGTRFTIWGFSA